MKRPRHQCPDCGTWSGARAKAERLEQGPDFDLDPDIDDTDWSCECGNLCRHCGSEPQFCACECIDDDD